MLHSLLAGHKRNSFKCLFLFSFLIVFIACKKDNSIVTPLPGVKPTLSAFSIINVSRGEDNAMISWTTSVLSSGIGTAKYIVKANDGTTANVGTATSYTLTRLDRSVSYNGQITAYADGADSVSTTFTINRYIGMAIFGRTDAARNQNVVEAYDIGTGTLLWQTKLSNYYQNVFSMPVISNDTVFIAANNKHPLLLNALKLQTGELIYSKFIGGSNTMGDLTYSNGKLFTVYNTLLEAIDSKTGNELWARTGGSVGFTGTPVEDNGTVYASTTTLAPGIKFKLFALDANTGSTKWTYDYDGDFLGRPYVKNGNIYFSTTLATYSLNAGTGTLNWTKNNDASFSTSGQFVFYNNTMISPGKYNEIYSVNINDGSIAWKNPATGGVQSTITIGNGIIYSHQLTGAGNFTALDAATGTLIWSRPSSYMFTLFANDRLYSISNFKSDIEISDAKTGIAVKTIGNPANYYTDNLTRLCVRINSKTYYLPYSGNY